MNTLPTNAARNLTGWKTSSEPASAVPTSTGATAAGSGRLGKRSRSLGELPEVRLAALDVGVPPLLGLLAHVEEQVGVVSQLLETGEPVVGRVEAGLEQA